MRWVTLAGLSLAAVGAVACSQGSAAAHPADGTLVLELGGNGPSLKQALVTAGVGPFVPQRLREPGSAPDDASAADESKADAPARDMPEFAPPVAAPAYTIVRLARGQTLIHLAKQHLGDGNRFRDLLALNGWTEADARRLPENQPVKVPAASRGAPPSGR